MTESIVGWVCATIMVLSVATCMGVTSINRQNLDSERIERCETNGGRWSNGIFDYGCNPA